jgi:ferrous iron transport protein B
MNMTSRSMVDSPLRWVLLVGNPNVGKSALFNALTGGRATVSNYPGTTVEVTRGRTLGPTELELVDTPGVRSLIASSGDEVVTRAAIDELFGERGGVVIQVADMKNLRRSLLLTLQLGQLGVRTVLGLNMADEAATVGLTVDVDGLSRALGVPVLTTVATLGVGTDALFAAVPTARMPTHPLSLSTEAAEHGLAALRNPSAARSAAGVATYHREMQAHADALAARFVTRAGRPRPHPFAERLGHLSTHPILGWPLLILVLATVYEIVGVFGAQVLVGWIEDDVFGQWINPALVRLFAHVPSPLVQDFFVGRYGLLTVGLTYGMAIVLPIVLTFFFVFAWLEDSGYLPRLAVMSDRLFRLMGLNGRAVLPMVLGLGCDTMATLTTRTLPSRKERVLATLLLALAVPCSAQLGVVLGMLAVLPVRATVAWLAVLLTVMIVVGRIAAQLLPGPTSAFVVELPPIRWPRPRNLVTKTLSRLEWYLREALPLFMLGTGLLFVLDRAGLLTHLTRLGEPIVTGVLGLPAEASEAFLIGFLRRDFAATHLFDLSRHGALDEVQTLVAMVTVTLFIPCIASVFIIVKEHGARTAAAIVTFVFPFAFAVGGLVRVAARAAGW